MIQLLRVTSEANPILEAGQLGYDTYRHAIKIGDGSTSFNDLPATAGRSFNLQDKWYRLWRH